IPLPGSRLRSSCGFLDVSQLRFAAASDRAAPGDYCPVLGNGLPQAPPIGRPSCRFHSMSCYSACPRQHFAASRWWKCPQASLAWRRQKTAEDLGDRGFASDGLESDDKGRVFLTDYEHNAILRRGADGQYETLVYDPRVLWPDTLSLATDGH